jgi:hypothetical protein
LLPSPGFSISLLYRAGAVSVAGTIAGLLICIEVRLFGFKDSFSALYARTSVMGVPAAFDVVPITAFNSLRRPATTGPSPNWTSRFDRWPRCCPERSGS